MATTTLGMNLQRDRFLVISVLAFMVLALIPAASAYTATLVSPTDLTNVHNGDLVSIRIDGLLSDNFQFNLSSTDLKTRGGTFSIDNFAMPFGFATGSASTSLVGNNLNESGLRLVVARLDGITITQQNQTSSNPYRIFLTQDILKTSYNISITGYPLDASGAVVDFSVRGNIANPNNPAFLNFTIQNIQSGNLQLRVYDGLVDQLNTSLAINSAAMDGVFRPSNGMWFIDTTQSGAVNKSFNFGTTGDVPLVGDWDGNGITDVAVFRPGNGNWFLDTNQNSEINKSFHFGTAGDIPVVGAWDADLENAPGENGAPDVGIFRPSNGNWFFDTDMSSTVNKTFHFGTTGDIPLVGDFDGNGISDVAVFRPSNGNWFIDTTGTGLVTNSFHFGTTGDIPVVGDFDGNGISDVSVFRPSNGNWFIDTTRTGVVTKSFHFGTAGDVPAVADWDGNGIADVAVFRPSNGNWFIDTTQTGVVTKTFHFGTNGDQPQVGTWI